MNRPHIKLLFSLGAITLGGCAWSPARSQAPAPLENTGIAATLPAPRQASSEGADITEPQIQLKPADPKKPGPLPETVVRDVPGKQEPEAVTATGPSSATHPVPHGVDAQVSLRWLKNGNLRFVKSHLRRDGQGRADVVRISKGQKPHSIVLSCSDSRTPPEIVFDQKLGEIFVVRTAGQSLDPNVIGSIEYAVEHLGPQLLIVMAHTSCGAVGAAIQTLKGGDAGSPSLNHLVADIHPRIRETADVHDKAHAQASWANARGIARDLAARSTIIQRAIENGRLRIQPALYHLDTGRVDFE